MHLSLNWIKRFIKDDLKVSANELQELVSTKVAELEGYESQVELLEKIVVGQIIDIQKHPNADKLSVCQVNVGKETVQIVCGGTNLEKDMLTAVALPGSRVRWHGEGDLITLEATKLRGEKSHGMICTSEEIGLGKPEDDSHIMNLNHLSKNIKPGLPISEALQANDVIFEIDNKSITNRPDLWGHIGFAREIAAITDTQFQYPKLPEIKTEDSPAPYTIKNTHEEICKRFSSLIIQDVKVEEGPENIKQDLEKVGLKPINNIVDALNHTMLTTGQPMHAYDFDKIKKIANSNNPELSIQYASKGKFTGIDQQEYTLTPEAPVLMVNQTPVCILGIMGGQNTQVDENTTTILLESATFTDSIVRKASQKLALRSDSSQRFEKSLDPNQTLPALQIATQIILEQNPKAKLSSKLDDQYFQPQTELSIKLETEKLNSYLGTQMTTQQISGILQKLEFKTKEGDKELEVTIPSFRASKDISIYQDLIEEVGRIYGYDKIKTTLPEMSSTPPVPNQLREQENKVRQLLMAQGLTETKNYSFYSEDDISKSLLSDDHIKVKNFLSEEQTHMRTHFLPSLLKNIHQNYKNNPSISLYEIGRTYHPTKEFFPAEEEKLALIHADSTESIDHETFFEVKGWLENLFQELNLPEIIFQTTKDPEDYEHPNITAEIKTTEGQILGKIFRVHPSVIKNYGIKKTKATYAEVNLGLLLHLSESTTLFQELPKFPDMEFDVSVIVDNETTHQLILKTLQESHKLVHHVELFDIFEDEQKIGKGKKACAYRLTLRSLDRTLTDEDLSNAQKACYDALQKIGGVVRGS